MNTAVETPYVLGMTYEYEHFCNNADFFNCFICEVVHAHYIVPMYMNEEPEKKEDGSCTLKSGSSFGFPSLKNPQDNTKDVFPVFTLESIKRVDGCI